MGNVCCQTVPSQSNENQLDLLKNKSENRGESLARPEPLEDKKRDGKEEAPIENANIQKPTSLEDQKNINGNVSREKQPEQKTEEIGETVKGATTQERRTSTSQKTKDEHSIIKRQHQKTNQVKNTLRNNL